MQDDFLLTIVQHIKQTANFVAEVLVPEQLEWSLSFLVSDDFAELSGIIVANRRIERSWTNRHRLELGHFPTRDPDFVAKLLVRGFTAKFLAHLQRNPAHLGNLVHQMHRQTDRLALIRQRPLDGLFDPPCGVRAKLPALRRIKTFDRLHQADVSLRDQVEKWQSQIRVIVRDFDNQAQIRTNHERPCLAVALLNLRGQFDFLIRSQKRDLPDLTQVNLNSSIAILSSHITLFHQ